MNGSIPISNGGIVSGQIKQGSQGTGSLGVPISTSSTNIIPTIKGLSNKPKQKASTVVNSPKYRNETNRMSLPVTNNYFK